ncbi:MAG: 5-methyltetrahydrofolate--homocysteine methyltransferase [Acidobacteriota bacterium]|nr:5-methyltetrahydrofolate--homocysteine methyltransferase [Acidobacteriota bacterium]
MSFAARLAHGPAVLLDGGMGSMLLARGLAAGETPESWTLERGEEIVAIHRAYVDAGSDAVQTNTFGAHPLRLAAAGLGGRAAETATVATALARRAGARYVIGNVGPTGEYLPPVGRGEPTEFRRGFAELGRAFAGAGVDALHVETMSDLAEAQIALAALLDAAPGIPVCVSLTFERRKRGFFTVMGNRLEEALPALAAAGATAVGANCTLTSADFVPLAAAARTAYPGPLILQPNAGAPRLDEGLALYDQSPGEFAADLAGIVESVGGTARGAVGGCCGTDPRFIAALAQELARRSLR